MNQKNENMSHNIKGNSLNLGPLPGSNCQQLVLTPEQRAMHLYVCGGTGTGKSKFLENCIRQDILNWRKSKCGLIVIDPHGSLFDSLMGWLSWVDIDVPVIPIDLRRDDWIISYNLLRQRKTASASVVVDNFVDAMSYVWGELGTDRTPLFARWAGHVLTTLYEHGYTLAEAPLLIDHLANDVRQALGSSLKDRAAKRDWKYLNSQTPKEIEAQLGSTINRFQRFDRNNTLRWMFGQTESSLDFGEALQKGQIILVSLATERAKISKENADLLATLLLSDLWTAAQERGKREKDGIKPFYAYIDEFQRFITPTMADNLDEARGYGLHVTMANQFPMQLLDRGEAGKRVYHSVMENASSKVVFRLTDEENLQPLAKWLFRGTMNPDEIKHELYSTKVMDYVEEYRRIYGESTSTANSTGSQKGHAGGAGRGGTRSRQSASNLSMPFLPTTQSQSWSSFASASGSQSHARSDSFSESRSDVPMLIPKMGKELSHVQFRSLEEQLFRAMAVLFDQEQRQFVARLVGMRVPVSIFTPFVKQTPASREWVEKYTLKLLRRPGIALMRTEAIRNLERREKKLPEVLLKHLSAGEPKHTKRIL
jgi:hypothetical protein